ncbi:hypothetical protein HII28_00415 [Planctomonas sp. JC2975]|uniref:hypothetical protein n=1 Tax=Planctomonas sp. JC2975 TaxID=2729626 RepID=UPI001475E480|nr:hypothetical protein [Planctomonas sp. JC2975]NNC10348.1 hypothetical protein [Planctomonas sp. JC2975]
MDSKWTDSSIDNMLAGKPAVDPQAAPALAPVLTHEQKVEVLLTSIRRAVWTIASLLVASAAIGLVWGIVAASQ